MTVVIGGILSSTALTLLVLPVLFTALRARRDGERGDGEVEAEGGPESNAASLELSVAQEERR